MQLQLAAANHVAVTCVGLYLWWHGEFFIQKAIGWALQQRIKQAPSEVQAFVRAHAQKLAPLSQCEALKHVGIGDDLDSDLSSAADAYSEKVTAPAAKLRRVATRGP